MQRNAFRGHSTKYKCLENFALYGVEENSSPYPATRSGLLAESKPQQNPAMPPRRGVVGLTTTEPQEYIHTYAQRIAITLLPYSGLFSRRSYFANFARAQPIFRNVEEARFNISFREITFRKQELNWLFAKYKRLENNPLYGIRSSLPMELSRYNFQFFPVQNTMEALHYQCLC